MLQERWVYSGEDWIPWEKATVHLASHSFARGSAIFEVLSLHDTPSGPMIFRLDTHLERLFQSARFLGMEIPLTTEKLQETVKETVRRNRIGKGVIKILGFHPGVALDILPPSRPISLAVFALDPEKDLTGFNTGAPLKASACISSWRKLDPQTVPVEAKASANYLNGMMARLEARNRGFDQAILLDTQGFVAEGGTESVFIVHEGRLVTPAGGTILQSITRKSILELAVSKGIAIREMRIPPRRLQDADEAFLSCTPFKVLPLTCIEERYFPDPPGPVTRTVASWMQRVLEEADEISGKWLFPLD